jgi:hypothetical protein
VVIVTFIARFCVRQKKPRELPLGALTTGIALFPNKKMHGATRKRTTCKNRRNHPLPKAAAPLGLAVPNQIKT